MLSEPHSLDKGCVIILMRLKYERTSQWPAREFNIGEKAHFQKKKIQCIQAKHCKTSTVLTTNRAWEIAKRKEKKAGQKQAGNHVVENNWYLLISLHERD